MGAIAVYEQVSDLASLLRSMQKQLDEVKRKSRPPSHNVKDDRPTQGYPFMLPPEMIRNNTDDNSLKSSSKEISSETARLIGNMDDAKSAASIASVSIDNNIKTTASTSS
jgi:hypothetical protein